MNLYNVMWGVYIFDMNASWNLNTCATYCRVSTVSRSFRWMFVYVGGYVAMYFTCSKFYTPLLDINPKIKGFLELSQLWYPESSTPGMINFQAVTGDSLLCYRKGDEVIFVTHHYTIDEYVLIQIPRNLKVPALVRSVSQIKATHLRSLDTGTQLQLVT